LRKIGRLDWGTSAPTGERQEFFRTLRTAEKKEDEAEELETPVLRPLVWLGTSLRNLRAFPDEAKRIIGDELQRIQFGGMPKDAKPFKGVGSGVFEIAPRHDAEANRTVLAMQLGRNIYVVHAFQKKLKKGDTDRGIRVLPHF
jgi:phage-related protein